MGAITPVNILPSKKSTTEFSGDMRVGVLRATLASASDTITLDANANNIATIVSAFAVIRSGQTTTFQSVHVTFSGLVLTLASLNGAGGASTSWGDVDIFIFGYGY